MLAGTLVAIGSSPAAAAPGDSVSIYGPYCTNGAGEVIFQVTNEGDTATELNLNVGPYTREATVPADTTLGFPITRIPDGTYTAQAIFFISVVASRQVTIDCQPDVDTSRLDTPTGVSASVIGDSLHFSWNSVHRADTYRWYLTRDGSPVSNRSIAGTSGSTALSGSGRYCISVVASGYGLPSSSASPITDTSCAIADPCATVTRLATPAFHTGIYRTRFDGNRLKTDWADVACAGDYHYHITGPGGFSRYGATAGSGLNFAMASNAPTGRYCVSVVAVNGGFPPDSRRANANGSDPYGCADRAGGPAPDPCVSNIRLSTPSFSTAAGSRARIEGGALKADWSDVTCVGEYHFHVTGPNGYSHYGATSTSDLAHVLTVGSPGKYCVSVVAVSGGRRPDSYRANANGLSPYGCATRSGPVDPNAGRLDTPKVTNAWVTHSGSQIRFDWGHIEGRAEYHWATHYPNGHVERGATRSTRQQVAVNNQYGGPICFEVIAVATGRDSEVSDKFCKVVDEPACARPDAITPAAFIQQSLRGFDLDLSSVEAGANAHNGNSNHVVTQSIFDPVVRNKDIIIDEYGLVFRAGPSFDTLPERQAFMARMAADMDQTLGGYFASQANFKNQGSPPVVGQVIDIDVDGQFAIDISHVNAPIVITHIESTCFGVKTIEYNGDEHVLHGNRRWGFEYLGSDANGVYIRFYTRGISIPDRFYPLAQSGEWTFWNAWIDEMVDIVVADGGAVIGGTDQADQQKVQVPTSEIWDQLTNADRVKIKAFQINAHQREADRLWQVIQDTPVRGQPLVRQQRNVHLNEIEGWRLIPT